jgi:hypothetical protein
MGHAHIQPEIGRTRDGIAEISDRAEQVLLEVLNSVIPANSNPVKGAHALTTGKTTANPGRVYRPESAADIG